MELRDYLNVIRARKWVIIQAVAIVTLFALAVTFTQPPVYQGEAKVLISEKDTSAALLGTVLPELSSQPERGLLTQVELMQIRPLAENTIRKLGLEETPEELLDRVHVTEVGKTNIVVVVAEANDPEQAADIANSMAEEYVTWSQEVKRERIKAAADEVEARLEDAKDQILELGRKIEAEGKTDDLDAELQIATGTYTTLAEKLEQLRINEQLETGSGRIVSTAVVQTQQVAPKPLRNTALGLAVGLLLGLGLAFLYEYLDDTVKSTEELERLYGAPVVGTIPIEKFDKGERRRLTIVDTPGSPAAESYRVLRNSLDFLNFEQNMKTLLVTSAAPAEGKSTVAANLAASLAQAGNKTVLVSCDFRRPTTEQFFNVNNMIGLSDVLTGAHSMKAALQRPGDEQLLIMTSGKMPPNPSELLGSTKMKELIESLEEWADWVIIDTPPLLAVADPAAVARWTDGVLMVTQAGKSTRDAAKKAVEMLEKVGAKVAGVVVWGIEEGKGGTGYGFYAGSYYYAGYYATDRSKLKTRASKSGSTKEPEEELAQWASPPSPGRQFARVFGRALVGLLGFLLIVALAVIVFYLLDQAMGWGILTGVLSLLP